MLSGHALLPDLSVLVLIEGAALGVVGFAFTDERGEALLRAEYLFLDGQTYGLRSSPA